MSIIHFDNSNKVNVLTSTSFKEQGMSEQEIQAIIKANPEILGEDLFIVSEELAPCKDSKKRMDLLAIDKEGNLVVIEIKRDDDGFHMDLQAIRYASMVRLFSIEDIIGYYQKIKGQQLTRELAEQEISTFLESKDISQINSDNVRILLVNQDFSKEITNAVLWLNEQGLDIKCIKITPYKLDGGKLWDVDTIIPVKDAQEYQLSLKQKKDSDEKIKQEIRSRDNTKYTFNGVEGLGKGRLVLAVVKYYCQENPDITLSELQQIFPNWLQEPSQISDERRFFLKEEEIIELKDKTKIAVFSDWGIAKINNFINHVTNELKYTIIPQTQE